AGELSEDHPAVGALSALLAHSESHRRYLDMLPLEQRRTLERLLQSRRLPWSAGGLEWQWAQVAAQFSEEQIDPKVPLPGQLFGSRTLEIIWSALMNLEVLRAWGLIT